MIKFKDFIQSLRCKPRNPPIYTIQFNGCPRSNIPNAFIHKTCIKIIFNFLIHKIFSVKLYVYV